MAFAVLFVGGTRHIGVGHGCEQYLAAYVGTAGVSSELTGYGRDVGAGAPSRDRQLAADAAQFVGIGSDPLHGGESVVSGRREAGFGSMSVVDRQDDGVGSHAQVTTERIVGLQAAEHPSASVEVGDDRMRTGAGRLVQPVFQDPGCTRQHAVNDLTHVGPGRTLGGHHLHERSGVLDRHRLDRGQVHRSHHLEHHGHVGLYLADDAVLAARRPAPRQIEAEVVLDHHLVASGPVGVDAPDIGQEHARLARNVGPHIPRVGRRVQGDGGAVVDVLVPARFRHLGGFDRLEALNSQVVEAVDDPVDVLLDRHDHVGQHRRASGPGEGEEVRETDGRETEVGRRTVGPLLPEGDPVPSGDVDADERTRHGVESSGVDDGVEPEGLVQCVDPRLGDRGDGVLA